VGSSCQEEWGCEDSLSVDWALEHEQLADVCDTASVVSVCKKYIG
jgi:hypothetical protein